MLMPIIDFCLPILTSMLVNLWLTGNLFEQRSFDLRLMWKHFDLSNYTSVMGVEIHILAHSCANFFSLKVRMLLVVITMMRNGFRLGTKSEILLALKWNPENEILSKPNLNRIYYLTYRYTSRITLFDKKLKLCFNETKCLVITRHDLVFNW